MDPPWVSHMTHACHMSHACHMLHAHYFTETKHQHKVQTVLRDLTPQQIKDLGLELGLYSNTLNKMPQTSIHGDMVQAWLIRCDDVLETSGNPSWRSLATALLNQGFGGPADTIRQSE